MKLSTGERGDDICHDTISHNLFLKQIKCKLFNCCGTKSQTTISLLLPVELDREVYELLIDWINSFEAIYIFLYTLRVIFGTMKEKNERKKRRGKRNGAIICYFILYVYTSISIYLSFRSYIFNKKLYRIYNRHCLLHFLYPNFYCTFPHGESLFCSSSFSLLFLILPSFSPLSFFSLWCKFSVFSYRKWSTREKRERKLCTIEHNVRWCRRKSGFLFEIDFSISENSRNIAISFFIAVQRSDSFEKLNSYR